MAKPVTRADYAQRLEKVAAFIDSNLDGDLSIDRLAEVACFSRFHFHRIYRAIRGETVAETVQWLRLNRAFGELTSSSSAIEEIARRAGYSSQAAFTRAFRDRFGRTPGTARQKSTTEETSDMEFEQRVIESIRCAAVLHRGPYSEIGGKFNQLYAWALAAGEDPIKHRWLAVCYDDPDVVAPADLRSHACMELDREGSIAPPAEEVTIAGGRYAVFRHEGPYPELHKTYAAIFRDGLPGAGLEPDDRPCFEVYLNNPRMTPVAELLTEIFVPVRA